MSERNVDGLTPLEVVAFGVRGCSACNGEGLVEVSLEAPTGDCPRCNGTQDDPGSVAEVKAAIAQLTSDAQALAALRRIVRRTLACGQFEKLEDARPYLSEGADQPAPTETCFCDNAFSGGHDRSCPHNPAYDVTPNYDETAATPCNRLIRDDQTTKGAR